MPREAKYKLLITEHKQELDALVDTGIITEAETFLYVWELRYQNGKLFTQSSAWSREECIRDASNYIKTITAIKSNQMHSSSLKWTHATGVKETVGLNALGEISDPVKHEQSPNDLGLMLSQDNLRKLAGATYGSVEEARDYPRGMWRVELIAYLSLYVVALLPGLITFGNNLAPVNQTSNSLYAPLLLLISGFLIPFRIILRWTMSEARARFKRGARFWDSVMKSEASIPYSTDYRLSRVNSEGTKHRILY